MKRLKPVNKFCRRYEVDLWGRTSGQRQNKTVRFLLKVQKEKLNKRFFKGFQQKKREKIHKTRDRSIKQVAQDKENKKRKNKNKGIDSSKYKAKRGRRKVFKKVDTNKNRINSAKKAPYHKKTFIYRIDFADPQRRKAKTSLSRELFLIKTKLLRFYSNIKKDQLRRYANTKTFKMKFKLIRGLGDQNIAKYRSKNIFKKLLALDAFFSLVEHRLDIMLYRSNFAQTIRQARQLINHRHVFVNGRFISHCGFILRNFDVVRLNLAYEDKMFKQLKKNLTLKRIALYPPRYIYVDYSLMISTLISNPLVSDVPFPFKIDLRKWLGLAKHLF